MYVGLRASPPDAIYVYLTAPSNCKVYAIRGNVGSTNRQPTWDKILATYTKPSEAVRNKGYSYYSERSGAAIPSRSDDGDLTDYFAIVETYPHRQIAVVFSFRDSRGVVVRSHTIHV